MPGILFAGKCLMQDEVYGMKITTIAVFLFLAFEFSISPCSAVEIAERISDREIVERLTRLEEGHKSLNNRFDDVNKRFDDVNKRFDDVNKRIDDVNKRIDDLGHIMNARFGDVNERLGDIMNFLHILAGAMLIVGGGVLGWLVVIWKRLARVV